MRLHARTESGGLISGLETHFRCQAENFRETWVSAGSDEEFPTYGSLPNRGEEASRETLIRTLERSQAVYRNKAVAIETGNLERARQSVACTCYAECARALSSFHRAEAMIR